MFNFIPPQGFSKYGEFSESQFTFVPESSEAEWGQSGEKNTLVSKLYNEDLTPKGQLFFIFF